MERLRGRCYNPPPLMACDVSRCAARNYERSPSAAPAPDSHPSVPVDARPPRLDPMDFQYGTVLFGLLFGTAFVLLNVAVLSRILAPKGVDRDQATVYECGEPAIGSAWVRFDMRFYQVALVFLIFEVELAFLFPWAVVYNELVRESGNLFAFLEVAVFVLVLGVGLVYVWAKGDLDWIKSTATQRDEDEQAGMSAPPGRGGFDPGSAGGGR